MKLLQTKIHIQDNLKKLFCICIFLCKKGERMIGNKIKELREKNAMSQEMLAKEANLSLVKVYLKTGRSHQIRVQFSSRNHPLFGDQKYNKQAKVGEQIALFASSLSFYHPTTKELLTFNLDLPKRKPWNLFS